MMDNEEMKLNQPTSIGNSNIYYDLNNEKLSDVEFTFESPSKAFSPTQKNSYNKKDDNPNSKKFKLDTSSNCFNLNQISELSFSKPKSPISAMESTAQSSFSEQNTTIVNKELKKDPVLNNDHNSNKKQPGFVTEIRSPKEMARATPTKQRLENNNSPTPKRKTKTPKSIGNSKTEEWLINFEEKTPIQQISNSTNAPILNLIDCTPIKALSPKSKPIYSENHMQELKERHKLELENILKQHKNETEELTDMHKNNIKSKNDKNIELERFLKNSESATNDYKRKFEHCEEMLKKINETIEESNLREKGLIHKVKELEKSNSDLKEKSVLLEKKTDKIRLENLKLRSDNVKLETKYEKLKKHAEETLQEANKEIEKLSLLNNEYDVQLKRMKINLQSSESKAEIKEKEKGELMKICDQLMEKLSGQKTAK